MSEEESTMGVISRFKEDLPVEWDIALDVGDPVRRQNYIVLLMVSAMFSYMMPLMFFISGVMYGAYLMDYTLLFVVLAIPTLYCVVVYLVWDKYNHRKQKEGSGYLFHFPVSFDWEDINCETLIQDGKEQTFLGSDQEDFEKRFAFISDAEMSKLIPQITANQITTDDIIAIEKEWRRKKQMGVLDRISEEAKKQIVRASKVEKTLKKIRPKLSDKDRKDLEKLKGIKIGSDEEDVKNRKDENTSPETETKTKTKRKTGRRRKGS